MKFDASACKNAWLNYSSYAGTCQVSKFTAPYLLENQKVFLQQNVKGREASLLIVFNAFANGYRAEAYGSDKIVGSYNKVEPYLLKALEKFKEESGSDIFYSHSLSFVQK
jgi:hypothetical protein